MSFESEMHIVDEALKLASNHLGEKGMPEEEAHIALLVRLWAVVPENVVEVAKILKNDPEIYEALNGGTSSATPAA